MPQYAKNKKALFDYELLDAYEAGLVLSGAEVKSVRNKQINLKGSYISILEGEAYLKNAHISPYTFAAYKESYDPERPRKLLLSKKEIAYLQGKTQEKGLTIVPVSVYTKGPQIKLELAIARGKKKHDKRASIKKREQNRQIGRAMKGDY